MLMPISYALISASVVTNIFGYAFYKRLSDKAHIFIKVFTVLCFAAAFLLGEIINKALRLGSNSTMIAFFQTFMLFCVLAFVGASLFKKKYRKKLVRFVAIFSVIFLSLFLIFVMFNLKNGTTLFL